MSIHTTGHPSGLRGFAPLIVPLLITLAPFPALSQTGSMPTAMVFDPEFFAACQRMALEVRHFQGEVDAGRQRPDEHHDDAVINFHNLGCTWEMFG